MPTPQPRSALDSLQTVEFRQTIRGYHVDDVDEYLERVASEVDALKEQLQQSGERMRQATDRIVQLEAQQREGSLPSAPANADDSLQKTLLLAQKFVEQTEAETKAQARAAIDEAEDRARALVSDAEERARTLADEAETRLREEVERLEERRDKLADEVETIAGHLESERTRLRGTLGEMLHWIDEHLQPGDAEDHDPPASRDRTTDRKSRAEDRKGRFEDRKGEEMAVGASTPRTGLQTLAQANTPNGSPR